MAFAWYSDLQPMVCSILKNFWNASWKRSKNIKPIHNILMGYYIEYVKDKINPKCLG